MNLRVLMIAGLVALWAVGIYAIVTLPPSVVTSWGNDGHVTYGSKFMLLILPAVGTFAFALIVSILQSGTIQLNVPFEILPEKMDQVQGVLRQMLEIMGALLLVGFACIEAALVSSSASGVLSPAFPLVMGGFVALVFTTIATMFIRIWQASR